MHNRDTAQNYHTRWARLSDGDGAAGHVIHGVALPPDTTARAGGEDIHFPASEIAAGAGSLEGESISVGHPDTIPYPVDETVGRITKSEWDDDLGLVYEGVISDDDIAQKINSGVLDVSAHVFSNDGDTTEDGAITAEDLVFAGLGVVSQGAAAGNTAEAGPLALAAGSEREETECTLSAVETALGATNDGTNGGKRPEDSGGSNGKNMSDNNDGQERISALEATVDEKDDRIAELEDALEDERERANSLEEQLDEQTQDLKAEYAEALANESALSADSLADAFDLEALKSQYETAVEAGDLEPVVDSSPTEPDVQSGAGGSSGSGSGGPSDDERERIEELEDELSELEGSAGSNMLVSGMVEDRENELAELKGEN